MTVTVLTPSDISTEAADFQADGTAASGSTGRVADSGHVHPTSSGYQIVSSNVEASTPDTSFGSGYWTVTNPMTVTLDAPAGYSVVNWFFSSPVESGESARYAGFQDLESEFASDGSSYTFVGNVENTVAGSGEPWGGGGTLVIGAFNIICVAS